MQRFPSWVLYTVAVVLFLFSLPGIIFAAHVAAKILYAVLILISIGAFTTAARRGRTSA